MTTPENAEKPKKREYRLGCQVCGHPKVSLINVDILAGEMTDTQIAKKYGILSNRGTPQRNQISGHRGKCLPTTIGRVAAPRNSDRRPAFRTLAQEIVASEDCLIEATRKLRARMNLAVDMGEETENIGDMVAATNAAKGLIELQAKLAGQIKDREVVVYADPNFNYIATQIMTVLSRFPEAHAAVLEALRDQFALMQQPIGIDEVMLRGDARESILAEGRALTPPVVIDVTPLPPEEPEDPGHTPWED